MHTCRQYWLPMTPFLLILLPFLIAPALLVFGAAAHRALEHFSLNIEQDTVP